MAKKIAYLLKMTPKQKKILKENAKANGMTIAAYLRYLATLKVETKIVQEG